MNQTIDALVAAGWTVEIRSHHWDAHRGATFLCILRKRVRDRSLSVANWGLTADEALENTARNVAVAPRAGDFRRDLTADPAGSTA